LEKQAMKNILVAANDTKGSERAVTKFIDIFSSCHPETVVLLCVEKYDASFLMDEMLGDSEFFALKEALRGTEYQETLNRRAQKIVDYYKKFMENKGMTGIKTVVKIGHPAEEILNTAKEEDVDMIVMGSRGKRFEPLMMGSVSREVANSADLPVLLIK
jgi:nucleotide-binding universal stress UspA family protein